MSITHDRLEWEHDNDINQEDEYVNRKLIWHFELPHWVRFNNLEKCVTLNSRYWWMTHEQMDWFYDTFFKGHEDEKHFPTPTVKYSNPVEVENCKSGVDRNTEKYRPSKWEKECIQRKEDYRYLKGGY